MPNKTTQILIALGFDNYDGNNWSFKCHGVGISPVKVIEKALAQQQQEDYQEILDLDIMKDEEVSPHTEYECIHGYFASPVERNDFRKELRQAIAQKRGKQDE